MPTLYLATRNEHKAQEIQAILGSEWRVASSRELDPQLDWDENGTTFRANALIKAKALRTRTPSPVLADDSGLEVEVLEGAPGVFSARYAGPGSNDRDNLYKLLRVLQGVPEEQRRARFVCVLCYLDAEGIAHYFEGYCDGRIIDQPRGGEGFGYDPIFVPEGQDKTFAELNAAEKNSISHRNKAMVAFQEFLITRNQ
ncbi:MAG TPA: RdgB/HAM1 family non-canonical purine NTP pyrophosphatase [Oligoflexus sp.]|uniref:RdgB/HAM1 family non-canonical purine NTP pyrophosphatase n=1 Tax=Oligoflexus sp. TaxID=1971216 RepID=UPI002D391578|nr:RdgB/HAM1 family non-canonical purine NTP pyrophosphatase [Oligoflexus sp.]HYX32491.1 RdgB/HAM1 family non-canonical purine NTP pyrophosphatase [Oligoflexus sp.]